MNHSTSKTQQPERNSYFDIQLKHMIFMSLSLLFVSGLIFVPVVLFIKGHFNVFYNIALINSSSFLPELKKEQEWIYSYLFFLGVSLVPAWVFVIKKATKSFTDDVLHQHHLQQAKYLMKQDATCYDEEPSESLYSRHVS